MSWTFLTLNATVEAEVRALPADMQARFLRFGDIVEQAGLDALPRGVVRHLEGKLWELRITGRDGISRAIYVTAAGRRVVVVRVLVNKTRRRRRVSLKLPGSGRRRSHDQVQRPQGAPVEGPAGAQGI